MSTEEEVRQSTTQEEIRQSTTQEENRETTSRGASAWRKIAVWLAGATLLGFVGYRGALGGAVVGVAPPSIPAAVDGTGRPHARDSPPAASTGSDGPSRGAAPPAPAAPDPSEDAPAASTETSPRPPSAQPPTREAAPETTAASPAITADGKIILNLATEIELRRLPGIGRARARAILEQRERLGRFRRLEDLLRIKGIGRKRLVALRPRVVLDSP